MATSPTQAGRCIRMGRSETLRPVGISIKHGEIVVPICQLESSDNRKIGADSRLFPFYNFKNLNTVLLPFSTETK